ncbi:MAG: 30S ribosomal protein S9 [Deltaproteobacteria bacterium]|nr:30S ribosomal protein S9 [Deltaproteobacteria bacterium]
MVAVKALGGWIHAVGGRKTAIARVFLREGSGNITVNSQSLLRYFGSETLVHHALYPIILLQLKDSVDLNITVSGGGKSSQAGAIRLGLARAILCWRPETKKTLREAGLLTRDSREVERKKPGLHKARKATQYSKR